MAELPKRVAALSLALVFLLTTVGFSAFIIWQLSQQGKNNNSTLPQTNNACGSKLPPAENLPTPEIYKPTGVVAKLIITDLVEGKGQAAKPGDCLNVKYYGTLASGKKFDDNFSDLVALQFPLGGGYVIPGWDQGLVGLKVGGTRRLVIPPSLAYGKKKVSTIPANSTLVFVVKLLKIGE